MRKLFVVLIFCEGSSTLKHTCQGVPMSLGSLGQEVNLLLHYIFDRVVDSFLLTHLVDRGILVTVWELYGLLTNPQLLHNESMGAV